MTDDKLLELAERTMTARGTIIGVGNTQRGEISDLAIIALQDVALELGDIVFDLRSLANKETEK